MQSKYFNEKRLENLIILIVLNIIKHTLLKCFIQIVLVGQRWKIAYRQHCGDCKQPRQQNKGSDQQLPHKRNQ